MTADSPGSTGDSPRERALGDGGPPTPPGKRRLADVIADTTRAIEGPGDRGSWGGVLTPDDRQRLLAVASRHDHRAPLDVALAAELVAAVLPDPLAAIADGVDGRRRLAERIARSLLDDPVSRGRLESLLAAIRAEAGPAPGAWDS